MTNILDRNGYGNDSHAVLVVGGSSTTFTDIGRGGSTHTITRVGDTTWSSGQQLFGQDTILFDGTGDRLTAEDSADYDFPGDFTVDWSMYYSSWTAGTEGLITNCNRQAGSDGWSLIASVGNALIFESMFSGGWAISKTFTVSDSPNTWVHFALVRKGTTISLYEDGVLNDTVADSPVTSITGASYALTIGDQPQTGFPYSGYMANIRITKGLARWSKTFVPPNRNY